MSSYPRTLPARVAATDVTETAKGFLRLGYQDGLYVLETSGSLSLDELGDAHLMLTADEVDELIADLLALRLDVTLAKEAVA